MFVCLPEVHCSSTFNSLLASVEQDDTVSDIHSNFESTMSIIQRHSHQRQPLYGRYLNAFFSEEYVAHSFNSFPNNP